MKSFVAPTTWVLCPSQCPQSCPSHGSCRPHHMSFCRASHTSCPSLCQCCAHHKSRVALQTSCSSAHRFLATHSFKYRPYSLDYYRRTQTERKKVLKFVSRRWEVVRNRQSMLGLLQNRVPVTAFSNREGHVMHTEQRWTNKGVWDNTRWPRDGEKYWFNNMSRDTTDTHWLNRFKFAIPRTANSAPLSQFSNKV